MIRATAEQAKALRLAAGIRGKVEVSEQGT